MSQSYVYMPNKYMAKYINVKGKRKEISNKDSQEDMALDRTRE